MLDGLAEQVNSNPALVKRGRWVNLTFVLGIDTHDYLVTIADGKIMKVEARQLLTRSGCFAVRASRSTWEAHWAPTPPRDYHDIWSMLPKNLVSLDGDLLPLIQNLQYFKDVIASLRAQET
jgi:hypothetical protein